MEVRAEILEALHSAAAEVDEVSKSKKDDTRNRDGRKIMARGWTSTLAGTMAERLCKDRKEGNEK